MKHSYSSGKLCSEKFHFRRRKNRGSKGTELNDIEILQVEQYICARMLFRPAVFLAASRVGLQNHPKIKGTRNNYFKTRGYCSSTKVKSPFIWRRFYATWPRAGLFRRWVTKPGLVQNLNSNMKALKANSVSFSLSTIRCWMLQKE